MNASFLHTLFPGQAKICGKWLPPLSLWRLSCLYAINSPFLSTDSNLRFTLGDLMLAVRCVRTPNGVAPNLRPRLRDIVRLWICGRSARYRQKHGANFLQYLALNQIRPELWQSEEGTPRDITAPVILAEVAALMACGISHDQAWGMSPGYAAWLRLACAERESDHVKFHTEDDDEINRQTDEIDQRSEAAIIAQAKADLPPAHFERWLSKRKTAP